MRATAICTWLTSLVRRVTRVGAPKRSASRAGSESAARKRAPRASVPTPWATMEAIFWHTRVDAYPTRARPTSRAPRESTAETSRVATPRSIICATMTGVIRSNTTSTPFASMPMATRARYGAMNLLINPLIKSPRAPGYPRRSLSSSHSVSSASISSSTARIFSCASMRAA